VQREWALRRDAGRPVRGHPREVSKPLLAIETGLFSRNHAT
jgi:hypothetical protein